MENYIYLNGRDLTLEDFENVVFSNYKVKVSDELLIKLSKNRASLEKAVESGNVIYGVNSGFGPMCNRIIPKESLEDLQLNLIRSHSSGSGPALSTEIVIGALLLRANSLARGFSGVRKEILEILLEFINHRIASFIPEWGSVGASGDLIHLSHIALTLIGEGRCFYEGEWVDTPQVLEQLKLRPIKPSYKEGLALINGTSVTTSISLVALSRAKKMVEVSVSNTAMIIEILEGTTEAFEEGLQSVKNHWGQQKIATLLRNHLKDSLHTRRNEVVFKELKRYQEKQKLTSSHIYIQDAYSLRCVPQILGPVLETIKFCQNLMENEANSTSDNPIILNEDDQVTVQHGGHFHAQYCAMAMDYLSIAVAEIGVLTERQVNRLTNNNLNGDLPPFLIPHLHGLRSGLMGLQYLATSTTAELQTYSNPLSVHSISTNADNQDIVSMGPSAALKALKQIERLYRVLAVGILSSLQGLEFRDLESASKNTRVLYTFLRERISAIVEDRAMYPSIDLLVGLLREGKLNELLK